MTMLSLGRAPLTGKTCILLSFGKFYVILDCGGSTDDTVKLPELENRPIYLLISHTHDDHTLSLSSVLREKPVKVIYSTLLTKLIFQRRAETNMLRQLASQFVSVPYNIKTELYDGYYFEFLSAGHCPGSAIIYISHHNYHIFSFTGDIETQRHFSYLCEPMNPTLCLVVDSAFAFLTRASSAVKSANQAYMLLLNIPLLHPYNAEGMVQETTARLQLFRRKVGLNYNLQIDYYHGIEVNQIVRKEGITRFFGDIIGKSDPLSPIRQQVMISVPTQLHSGSSAGQIAHICLKNSVLLHYDMCISGDSFRLVNGLVYSYYVGYKVCGLGMKNLKMWGDYHLDFKDICRLIDHAMPAELYLQHALKLNELTNAKRKLIAMFPFVNIRILKDSNKLYTLFQHTEPAQKCMIHRVLIQAELSYLVRHFEMNGILLDQSGGFYHCGRILVYSQGKYHYSIVCYAESTYIGPMVQEIKYLFAKSEGQEAVQCLAESG